MKITFPLQSPFLTGCSPENLWDLSATDATFLSDVSSLGDAAARYPSCINGSVGSVVLMNTTLNTATVAYYTGTATNSTACFVCDENSGYALSLAITGRVCQPDATWSENPNICGKKLCCSTTKWHNMKVL